MSKDPALIISDKDIINTHFFSTVLIIVPDSSEKEFLAKFDNEQFGIVPRSLKLIDSDSNSHAYVLLLLSKFETEYSNFMESIKCKLKPVDHGFESAVDFWERKSEYSMRLSTTMSVFKSWYRICCEDIFHILMHINIILLHIKSILKFGQILHTKQIIIFQLAENAAKNFGKDFINSHVSDLSPIYRLLTEISSEMMLLDGGGPGEIDRCPNTDCKSGKSKLSISTVLADSENHDVPFNLQSMLV
ncbi:MAG: hypothetical protein MHMPM18_003167 [Marteilia pararefringens]